MHRINRVWANVVCKTKKQLHRKCKLQHQAEFTIQFFLPLEMKAYNLVANEQCKEVYHYCVQAVGWARLQATLIIFIDVKRELLLL